MTPNLIQLRREDHLVRPRCARPGESWTQEAQDALDDFLDNALGRDPVAVALAYVEGTRMLAVVGYRPLPGFPTWSVECLATDLGATGGGWSRKLMSEVLRRAGAETPPVRGLFALVRRENVRMLKVVRDLGGKPRFDWRDPIYAHCGIPVRD